MRAPLTSSYRLTVTLKRTCPHIAFVNSGLLLRMSLARSRCFGCTRLVRLLDELVNPRLEHLAELLVAGIAEGAAGEGGTGRLRGGVRAWVAGLGGCVGGGVLPPPAGLSRAPSAAAAAALARRRLLRTLRVREAFDD